MMLLTTLSNEYGTRKIITSPLGTVPDFIRNLGMEASEQKCAVAVMPFWPEECMNQDAGEGERKWGANGMLGFPKNAEINDILQYTYIEGEEVRTLCWGWYCGIGGMFDLGAVRFLDG